MTEAPASPAAESGQLTAESTPETPQQESERTFTQADLKKIAANEKREGKKSAHSEIVERAQQYGVESLDDVFSILEAHQLTQAEMETEADKAARRAEKAEAAAQTANERYTNTLREFALRDALRDSGINPERLRAPENGTSPAMRLANLSALEVDQSGNVSGIEEVIEAMKKDAPEWFGEQGRPRVNAPQTSGTGVQRIEGAGSAGDDPKARMGQSLFGWLTDPIPEEERNTWP